LPFYFEIAKIKKPEGGTTYYYGLECVFLIFSLEREERAFENLSLSTYFCRA
jgi:hypothetical protein